MKKTFRLLAANLLNHDVGKSAAALAYYLLFALFPLMIFVSNLLGMLNLNVESVVRAMHTFLPTAVVELLGAYLDYVSDNSSQVLLWFSLVFTLWFPLQAVRGLMDDVRLAYGLGKPKRPVFYALRQVMFTLVFLLLVILTLLLSIMGQRVVEAITAWIPALQTLSSLLTLWQYLRFVLAAAIMFGALALLYASAQDQPQKASAILPGVAVAIVGWLAGSIGFSFYVENFASYSVIYGTLGAVIVLLSWLFITATMLIFGSEFNAALRSARGAEKRDVA